MTDASSHTRNKTHESDDSQTPAPHWAPWLAGVLLLAGLWGVGMVATRQSWNPGFAYLAIMIEIFVINFLSVAIWNHVLIGRRIGVKSGTKGWDYAVMLLGFTPGVVGMYVAAWWQNDAAGLAPIDTLWWVALLILGLGWAIANWSMIVNPFFEKTVRIQSEHGHQVVDSGPYRYVRHPGYVGFVAWMLTTPILLGSSWAWAPALYAAATLVLRTHLEDRTLRNELAGYTEYSNRVQYRLIPGVW